MSFDKSFNGRMLRVDSADAAAVLPLGLGPERVCFWKQPAGIERHDVDIERQVLQNVKDDLILRPKAGGEDDFASHRAAKMRDPLARMQRAKAVVETRCQRDQGI